MNPEIYRDRIQRLQEGMAEEDLDLMLLFSLDNYIYFSGDVRKQALSVPGIEKVELKVQGHRNAEKVNQVLKE